MSDFKMSNLEISAGANAELLAELSSQLPVEVNQSSNRRITWINWCCQVHLGDVSKWEEAQAEFQKIDLKQSVL